MWQVTLLAGAFATTFALPPLVALVLGPAHYCRWRGWYLAGLTALECTAYLGLRCWDLMPGIPSGRPLRIAFKASWALAFAGAAACFRLGQAVGVASMMACMDGAASSRMAV